MVNFEGENPTVLGWVAKAPVQFECRVNDIIPLGKNGGAGNLVICEVLLAHIKDTILNENGKIDPHKLDAVARMGEDWYTRAAGDSLFQVPKPTRSVGVDQLPQHIRESEILSGNDLGRLANIESIPDAKAVKDFHHNELDQIMQSSQGAELELQLHYLARKFLQQDDLESAWLTLRQSSENS